MCGLAGLVAPHPVRDLDAVIRGMNRTLDHRGPDQEGIFLEAGGRAALAHKRLSIIDLVNGRQPMTDAGGALTLVFNGEIYNHAELKAELLAKGQPIATRSDTETLLYAYKQWGAGCLPKLRGMFAFAVFDHRDGSIFLARDRLGIKPMYYAHHEGTLLFASEAKAILAYPGFPRDLDLQAMSDFFSLMYVPAPKSIFKGIRKLPAGHWLRMRPGAAPEIKAYWDLEFPDVPEDGGGMDFGRARDELLSVLEESVKSHMESDVPLGAFLSGGVDSAAVVALMARNSSRPILTNTIGFDHKAFDESAQAAETAAFFKADHKEFRVSPDAVGILDKLAWYYDEPFADSSMIPTYYVCGMTRSRVTVALSGDGGDENFAGYRRYWFDRLENRVRGPLPAFLRRALFGTLGAAYPKADWLPQRFRAKTLLQNLARPPVEGYFRSLTHVHPEMKSRLFSGDLKRSLGGYRSLSVFEEHWDRCRSRDPLTRVQYLDFKTYLADDILAKVDRASMAHSLEVRVPVLDHKVVEMAAKLPSGWKLKGKASKYIFKEALKPVLPASIFARKKAGFSMPLAAWLRGDLREFAASRLFDAGGAANLGLFEGPELRRMWDEHQRGLRDHSFPLFAFLSFSCWHAQFATGRAPAAPGKTAA